MSPWLPLEPQPLDLILGAVVLLYALHGYRQGWLLSVVELVGFAVALVVAIGLYSSVARQLVAWTSLPYAISKPAAFLLLWLVTDMVYGAFVGATVARGSWRHRRPALDRLLGLWPGAVRGLLVSTLLLTVAASLPFPEPLAVAVRESRLSQALEPRASVLAEQFSQIFGDAVQETVGLLTVRPESDDRVNLQFRVSNPRIDAIAEARMLELVNRERTERGVKMLEPDETLREVARQHSRDMFGRGYFAHVDPDGRSPLDRMRQGGARFRAGGENLALAPTVEVAHNGLMNSPGHRANILNPTFGRVGIGVEDGGLNGKMFTQNFAD
jgi:uncharacterized protein YkwD